VQRLLSGTIFAELVPARDLAYALVAMSFGVEMLARLDRDHTRAEELFASGARLAPLVDLILTSDIQLGDGSQTTKGGRDDGR
jgi:hypothetical protein